MIIRNTSQNIKHECLSEAKSFIDGFRKNGISRIERTKEKTIFVSEGVNRKELADNGDIIVLPNNTNIDFHKILALLYVYEISDEVLYSGWTIGNI